MKDHISFTTTLFDSGDLQVPQERQVAGEDLARWLINKTRGDEFVFGEPFENKGIWSEAVSAEGEKFELGFELTPTSAGADYAEWTIKIDQARKWSMFRQKDSQVRGRLCDLIHNVLRDEREIREVQWSD